MTNLVYCANKRNKNETCVLDFKVFFHIHRCELPYIKDYMYVQVVIANYCLYTNSGTRGTYYQVLLRTHTHTKTQTHSRAYATHTYTQTRVCIIIISITHERLQCHSVLYSYARPKGQTRTIDQRQRHCAHCSAITLWKKIHYYPQKATPGGGNDVIVTAHTNTDTHSHIHVQVLCAYTYVFVLNLS